jgi:hypothetical protein
MWVLENKVMRWSDRETKQENGEYDVGQGVKGATLRRVIETQHCKLYRVQ